VMSGGVERVYYLRMPENYSRFGDPQPIIFGLHGATGTYMDWFEGGFHGDGLQELVGDQAIMVFPQALESTGGITLWNAEHDFAYFEDMLAKLKGQLQIDPNRIFVTGHSAGGGFTHQLGCEFGDVIRAIAPSSGALTARECIGSVAVMQMQSNQDMVTPIGIVVPSRNFWVAYNGFDRDTFSDGIVEPCIDYSLGASLYPVQWCEHSSTGFNGHQWWDGADEAIWAFFSSLPTAAPSPEPPPGGGNDAVLEEFPALLTFTVHYPEDILEVIIFGAVLYPAGTMQPIFNAPLWFLNTEIPFAPAIPGSVQTYTDVPIAIFESSPGTPLPGTYTLSISAFVLGGSFPIPATGIDHIALHQIEIQDQLSPIVVEEVLELVPVESF
jgi:dienelactone hydrolase